ncbi:cytochrome P450 71AP13-like isoform X2 [Elaeis guineensis]|uniref:cytochrome P450 71AP13-like isoform X2 n=1 Tax=Elaeis guineensis var. tenera TaxID=51953 RepID=UPI003C6D8191
MEPLLSLLVYSCLLLLSVAVFLCVKATWPSPRFPPGPLRLPIIGNLHQLGENPYRSLRFLSEKYGPLMSLKLGCIPTIIVSSSKIASEILKTQDVIFCTRPPLVAFKRFSYGGRGIGLSPYGEQWRQLRRISMLEVFSAKRVQAFQSIREEEVNVLVQTLLRRISSDGDCTSSKYHILLNEMMSLLGGFILGDFFPSMGWLDVLTGTRARLERSFHSMDELLEEEIEKHMHGGGSRDDFIGVLLEIQKDLSLGFPLTRDHIKASSCNISNKIRLAFCLSSKERHGAHKQTIWQPPSGTCEVWECGPKKELEGYM